MNTDTSTEAWMEGFLKAAEEAGLEPDQVEQLLRTNKRMKIAEAKPEAYREGAEKVAEASGMEKEALLGLLGLLAAGAGGAYLGRKSKGLSKGMDSWAKKRVEGQGNTILPSDFSKWNLGHSRQSSNIYNQGKDKMQAMGKLFGLGGYQQGGGQGGAASFNPHKAIYGGSGGFGSSNPLYGSI